MRERRDAILKFIESSQETSIAALSERFSSWSEMTIRRDLAALAAENRIILTRGGARPVQRSFGLSEDVYGEREQRNREAKMLIAEKAVKLMPPGKAIYIDSGTTAMEFARLLPDTSGVIVTNAPNIALELASRKKAPRVVLLGGTLLRRSLAVAVSDLDAQLAQWNIDTAFLAASGYDAETGFTVGSQEEGVVKRGVIARAKHTVMLLDSSKIGVTMPFTFASIDRIGTLVSDDRIPAELKQKLSTQTILL